MSLDLREAQKRLPTGCTPYTQRPSSTASCRPSSGAHLEDRLDVRLQEG